MRSGFVSSGNLNQSTKFSQNYSMKHYCIYSLADTLDSEPRKKLLSNILYNNVDTGL